MKQPLSCILSYSIHVLYTKNNLFTNHSPRQHRQIQPLTQTTNQPPIPPLRSKRRLNLKANIIIKRCLGIKRLHTAITSSIQDIIIMSEIPRRITPRSQRSTLSIQRRLRTESSILMELLRAIIGIKQQLKVVMPDIATRGINRLEREALTISQTGHHGPASLLLQRGGTIVVHDLRVHSGVSVRNIPRRVTGRSDTQRDHLSGGERRAADQRAGDVFRSHDVLLDGVLDIVRRVAGGHDTLVEGTLGAVAVVTADTQDDSALLAHGVIAGVIRASAAVVSREGPRGSITTANSPLISPALDRGSDKAVADRGITGVISLISTGEEVVLHIDHDPGPVAGAVAPGGAVPEVDGLHVAGASVGAAGLGVAVVEAAGVVVVRAVQDGVHAFGLVAGGSAGGFVVTVARAGGHEHAVGLLAIEGDGGADGAGEVVVAVDVGAVEASRGCLGQVVAVAGLVVDDGDQAGGVGTEGVLGGGVGDATGCERGDGGGGVVGATLELIEGAAEGAV